MVGISQIIGYLLATKDQDTNPIQKVVKKALRDDYEEESEDEIEGVEDEN